MKTWTLFTALSLLSLAPVGAAEIGYLVKVDGSKVFLDYGADSGVRVGQGFVIFEEGDELIHPITGKSLGHIQKKLAAGTIDEVLEVYSIGRLHKSGKGLTPGSRVRLVRPTSAPATAVSAREQAPRSSSGEIRPRWTSPSFDFKIVGAAYADFDGDGALETVLADEKRVYLYPYPPTSSKALAEYKNPAIMAKVISLEAGDLNGNGKAELFVSIINDSGPRAETLILELGADGNWAKVAIVPWLVRAHQDGKGRQVLATQQLSDDKTFPFSTIYPLIYADGEHKRGKGAIRQKRIDWIYDFTTVDLGDDKPALVYHTKSDRLRVQFKKGYWKSSEVYGRTPVRLRWAGRLLQARPSPQVVYGSKGFDSLYIINNNARLGGWAKSFGLFKNGELHRKKWDGVGLVTAWKAKLTGYSTALSLVRNSRGVRELAVAVVGTTGKSAVWIYDL